MLRTALFLDVLNQRSGASSETQKKAPVECSSYAQVSFNDADRHFDIELTLMNEQSNALPFVYVVMDPTAYREYLGFLYDGPVKRSLRLEELVPEI